MGNLAARRVDSGPGEIFHGNKRDVYSHDLGSSNYCPVWMGTKPRITVNRFADPDPSIFDPSPFTTKLECLLRMTSTTYALAKGIPPNAPNGKIPYITFDDGKSIGDSTICYRYLQKHEKVPDVDAHLTDEERALSMSHKAWIEEWCYFLLLWDRYIDNPKAVKEGFFRNALPPRYRPFTGLLFMQVRRYVKKSLHLQGVLRHSREDILSFIEEAAKSISVLVGEKGLLEGKAAGANACVLGLFVTIYNGPTMSPNWYKEIRKYPNLRPWTEGMIAKYFPERKILPLQPENGDKMPAAKME